MRYSYCLFAALLIFFYSHSFAQDKGDSLVTGNFKDLKAEQFIRELESQTSFHFYYDPKQLDSLQINVTVDHLPLKKVLTLAFENTTIHFSIDQHKNIFLTKD